MLRANAINLHCTGSLCNDWPRVSLKLRIALTNRQWYGYADSRIGVFPIRIGEDGGQPRWGARKQPASAGGFGFKPQRMDHHSLLGELLKSVGELAIDRVLGPVEVLLPNLPVGHD